MNKIPLLFCAVVFVTLPDFIVCVKLDNGTVTCFEECLKIYVDDRGKKYGWSKFNLWQTMCRGTGIPKPPSVCIDEKVKLGHCKSAKEPMEKALIFLCSNFPIPKVPNINDAHGLYNSVVNHTAWPFY